MNRVIQALAVVIFALILLSACNGGGTPACPRIGDKAPDFTLPGLDGKNVNLSDFAGKPVIVNTWSTSCIECKKEMPFFQEIAGDYASKGLVILSVNTLDSASTTREFLSQNGYTFTSVLDLKNDLYKIFCCPKSADPNTFFISSDGIIKSVKIGGFVSKEELDSEVSKIISK